ncbi:MAG: alpha/beta hydrolase [Actinobacteria bacterium]|nr:alpha/beta hydrolase [Actinomycetota bacterium]
MAVDSVPEQRVKNGPADIAYWVHGDGEPLVLITGLATPATAWGPLPAMLASGGYRVVVLDNRDAGRSGRCPEVEYTMADMASDVIAVLDALGLERANVLGISLGGMIAQEVALNHPRRVKRLVLVSTDPGVPERVIDQSFWDEFTSFALLPPEERMRALVRLMTAPGFLEKDARGADLMITTRLSNGFEPDAFMRQITASINFSSAQRLPHLKMPVMVIHGTQDRMIPFPNGRKLADLIPDCELVEVETSGHLVPAEAPQEFLAALARFVPSS